MGNSSNYHIAVIGQPNVGKSTLINLLTKNYQLPTGNWSGVTVDLHVVKLTHNNINYYLYDLPGIYSLNPTRPEEHLTLQRLTSKDFDLYLNVVDGTNLTQNLNLTLQLRELNVNLMIVINFADIVKKQHLQIDVAKLKTIFNSSVYLFSSRQANLTNPILTAFEQIPTQQKPQPFYFYKQDLINLFENLQQWLVLNYENKLTTAFLKAYLPIAVLQQNVFIKQWLTANQIDLKPLQKLFHETEINWGMSLNEYLLESRTNYFKNLILTVLPSDVGHNWEYNHRLKLSLKVDRVLTHRYFGIPIALAIFFLGFILVFNLSTPLKAWLDLLFSNFVSGHIAVSLVHPAWLASLLINGVVGGVGTIMSFLPLVTFLFIFINLLRETGYLTRVNFLLEMLLNKIGLAGESLVPMILGFGCNVSSIYASKLVQTPKKRTITVLMVPFVSCSARLAIISLFSYAFFPQIAGIVMFLSYLLSIFAAVVIAKLMAIVMRVKIEQYEQAYEISPYHLPALRVLGKSIWLNVKDFLKKASSLILITSVVLWVLAYFPYGVTRPDESILAVVSKAIGVIFIPLGFGHIWQLVAAIFPAIQAKETTINALGVFAQYNPGTNFIPSVGELFKALGMSVYYVILALNPTHWLTGITSTTVSLGDQINHLAKWLKTLPYLTTTVAISYLIFMILTIPCVSTLAVINKEYGWKITLVSIGLGLGYPYLLALIFYQFSRIFTS